MSSSTIITTGHAATTHNRHLLSLPYEIKVEIYKYILYPSESPTDDQNFDTTSPPASGVVDFLSVCRQIHDEATPLLYKKITISPPLNYWVNFFERIGPRNTGLIQNLTIQYALPKSDWLDSLSSTRTHAEKWRRILGSLARQNKVDTIRVEIAADERTYTRNEIYVDLTFLKHLSRLSNVREIELKGPFNPFWGLFLHQRLGFIVQRYQPWVTWCRRWVLSHWMLIKPEQLDLDDLRGFVKAKLIDGVYDEETRRRRPRRNYL
ncbi:hypothetical protein F4779DRAFT_577638 [Xylariaceae sp. FL0662B]|nr:hypothetical protein F4779DRAFT_577638 [Xylariaceae sp. FL0662B]